MSRLGVCSWSLQPKSPHDLAQKVRSVGVRFVHLALDPIRTGEWSRDETVRALKDAEIEIVSGMMGTVDEDYSTLEAIRETGGVRPDVHWPANLEAARTNARLARELDIPLVTLHAGFIPDDRNDQLFGKMVARLRTLVGIFYQDGIDVGFETGQETATTLREAHDLIGLSNLGVNFDPANMILYGMGDPVEALRTLADEVRQIHVKDATSATTPGTWGEEVVVGTGGVDWKAFFDVVREKGLDCDLMIEREAGTTRVEDAQAAKQVVLEHMQSGVTV